MKIIIASDSFKGSLTSPEAGEAMSRGFRQADPTAQIRVISIGDGGEGTLYSLTHNNNYEMIDIETINAVGIPIVSQYGLSRDGKTAIIELATACGLARLKETAPMTSSTLGTGIMVADAIKRGATTVYVALGGSASTDGGMGLLTALGYRFYDIDDKLLYPMGQSLSSVSRIDGSNVLAGLSKVTLIGACDVTNISIGQQGAAAVFGPQKGATPRQVAMLDNGMRNYLSVLQNFFGCRVQDHPRTGAAGATGAALKAMGAKLISGAEMCIESTEIEHLLTDADLLVTGEGQADAQSLMGKITGILLQYAHRKHVPSWIVAARIKDRQLLLDAGFQRVIQMASPSLDPRVTMISAVAEHCLAKACQQELKKLEHITSI